MSIATTTFQSRRKPTTPQPLLPMAGLSGLLQRKCACGSPTSSLTGQCEECKSKARLQAKLTIGASDDPLEQEADRVAEQVVATPAHPAAHGVRPRIQHFTGQAAPEASTAPASVDRVLASSGKALDPAVKHDMEQRFGHDFSQVRVHTDAKAAESARAVNAQAYTVGNDVVIGSGRYAPYTNKGRLLLAHELTHVVQQRAASGTTATRQVVSDSCGHALIAHNLVQAISQTAPGPVLRRKVTTDNCETLEFDVKSAHDKAMAMTNKALALLKGYDGTNPSSVRDALSQHFHTTNVDDATNIIHWIEVAKSGAEDAQYECHETEENGSAIGWSMWCVPFTDILLYEPWFESSRTLTKRAKTMIHEWMHRYSCMYDLGYESSDEYKQSSTFRAVNNASSYAAVIEALGA